MNLEYRRLNEVNTEPQRRCYYGAHAKSELIWTPWEVLESNVAADRVENRLEFWRDLNAYAVRERGKANTLREYRVI